MLEEKLSIVILKIGIFCSRRPLKIFWNFFALFSFDETLRFLELLSSNSNIQSLVLKKVAKKIVQTLRNYYKEETSIFKILVDLATKKVQRMDESLKFLEFFLFKPNIQSLTKNSEKKVVRHI